MQFIVARNIALTSEFLSDLADEDDIDRLFQKLLRIDPPTETIQHILSRIKQLPASQIYQRPDHQTRIDEPEDQVSSTEISGS